MARMGQPMLPNMTSQTSNQGGMITGVEEEDWVLDFKLIFLFIT